MSYDLYLRDPATHEELQVPAHMMHGGNIPCEVINGQFIPTTTTRAYLNVTYIGNVLNIFRFSCCPQAIVLRQIS